VPNDFNDDDFRTNISTATPPLCNTPEETPRQKVPPSPGATMAPSISSVSAKLPMEPNVDFELDVKVGIDSGKCVLHPKEPKPDGDPESRRFVTFYFLIICSIYL